MAGRVHLLLRLPEGVHAVERPEGAVDPHAVLHFHSHTLTERQFAQALRQLKKDIDQALNPDPRFPS